jgi:large subunit ribosomal protein LP0
MPLSREKKEKYFAKLRGFLDEFNKCFLVGVDNVGSLQLAQIRMACRGKAEILMGKNTMIRKILREYLAENPGHGFEKILPLMQGNIGFVFTNGDLAEVKKILDDNQLPAPARVGAIAPCNVICPAGPTGCDPGQTSFFQALQIQTKITKGQIEIINQVTVTLEGEKVGASEAALLQKLDIKPFAYGCVVQHVYDDGALFSPKVLDMTNEILQQKFNAAAKVVASVALVCGVPTLASLPHSVAHAFNNCVALAIENVDVAFDEAAPYKDAVGVKPAAAPAAEEAAAPAEEAAAPAPAADY